VSNTREFALGDLNGVRQKKKSWKRRIFSKHKKKDGKKFTKSNLMGSSGSEKSIERRCPDPSRVASNQTTGRREAGKEGCMVM